MPSAGSAPLQQPQHCRPLQPMQRQLQEQQQQQQQQQRQHQCCTWSDFSSAFVTAAVALLLCTLLLDIRSLVWQLLQLGALLAGVLTSFYCFLSRASKYVSRVPTGSFQIQQESSTGAISAGASGQKITSTRATEFSHDLESLFKEIIEYLIRDCVMPWYCRLSHEPDRFCSLLRDEAWLVINKSSEMLTSVDWLHFLAVDVVNVLAVHLANVRKATVHDSLADVEQPFRLHPCARSLNVEAAFLRTFSEFLHARLLSSSYTKPLRTVLVNVVATAVLKPAADLLSNPDTYNQWIVNFLSLQEAMSAKHKQCYKYADSYEGFVKMIEKCITIADLKQFRYHIIQELMHATAVHSLRLSSEKDDQSYSPPSGTQLKVELLKARNLKVYLNQLKVAKSICEKRMVVIGGSEYQSYISDASGGDPRLGHCSKLVPFATLLQSLRGREAIRKHLRNDTSGDMTLLDCWQAIDALKCAEQSARYQLASDIYRKYARLIQERSVRKAMEAYLIGDSGPDAFFKMQDIVAKQLEERHYASFVVSDSYWASISLDNRQSGEACAADAKTAVTPSSSTGFDSPPEEVSPESHPDDYVIMEVDQSVSSASQTMRRDILVHRLEEVNEKIFNKSQALQGLRATVRTGDPKYDRVVLDLEKTLESLQLERHHLECHRNFDELWWKNIGKWRATVYGAEVVQEGGKPVLHFVVIVQPSEFQPGLTERSWLILRTLDECWNLRNSSAEVDSRLEKIEFPAKRLPRKCDDSYIEKAKGLLEAFICILLRDERLKHSEALYHFLCPTPLYIMEQLTPIPVPRSGATTKSLPALGNTGKPVRSTSAFAIPKLFKKPEEEDDDQLLLFDEEETARDTTSKFSLVKPLYALASEIFELHGVFRWFRRTLIHIVQVAYGKNINRQLQELVSWTLSEPMLAHYLRVFRDTLWPGGSSLNDQHAVSRTDEQRARTRKQAQELLARNIPVVVKKMFGDEAAKRGTAKLLEALQDERLNRHLVYALLETLLRHLVPELAEEMCKDSADEGAEAGVPPDGKEPPYEAQQKTDAQKKSAVAALPAVASSPAALSALAPAEASPRHLGGYVESLKTWGPQR